MATDEGGSVRTRLTVEMVPRTCWYRNVRSEVSPTDWNRHRRETVEKAGKRCEVCGAAGRLECHEVWEYDDEQHVQKLSGLVALCYRCHESKHIGLAGVRGRREQATEHLAWVNGWSREDAELYIEAVFETWHRRSRHEWTLDLTWLEASGVMVQGKRTGCGAPREEREGLPASGRRLDSAHAGVQVQVEDRL